jgi:predicted RNA-binding Zn-ribbon protein involved in translation (DUF1610 family)
MITVSMEAPCLSDVRRSINKDRGAGQSSGGFIARSVRKRRCGGFIARSVQKLRRAGGQGVKAHFYCANCGTEVAPKAERCPACGKFFTAVTCPACGFEADVDSFLKGCPACGYLVDTAKEKARRVGRRERSGGFRSRKSGSLPPLFYRIVGIALGAALVALLVILLLLSR